MKLKINSSFTINNVTYKITDFSFFLINDEKKKFYIGTFQNGKKKFWIYQKLYSFSLYTKVSDNLSLNDSDIISTEKVIWQEFSGTKLDMNGILKTYNSDNKIYKLFQFDNNENLTFLIEEFNSSISKYISSSVNEVKTTKNYSKNSTFTFWDMIVYYIENWAKKLFSIFINILPFAIAFLIFLGALISDMEDNDDYHYYSSYGSIRHSTTSGGVHFGK